jgi:hypothetical protein
MAFCMFLPKTIQVGDVVPVKINGQPGHTVTWTDANTLTISSDDRRKISSIVDFDEAKMFWYGRHATERLTY